MRRASAVSSPRVSSEVMNVHENAFNSDELRGSLAQSSAVRLTTEMQLFLGVLGQSGERGTGSLRIPHAAERVLMLGCDEYRRREWRGRRRRGD